MMAFLVAFAVQDPAPLPPLDGTGAMRGLLAVVAVLGLLLLAAWLLRRGTFGRFATRAGAGLRIETAVPLGERRSLVVVRVEGRRLLLGLTPASVSLVTELQRQDEGFADALTKAAGAQGQEVQ